MTIGWRNQSRIRLISLPNDRFGSEWFSKSFARCSLQWVYGKTAVLFCRAAKLRGEKLFCFSPSYNHYTGIEPVPRIILISNKKKTKIYEMELCQARRFPQSISVSVISSFYSFNLYKPSSILSVLRLRSWPMYCQTVKWEKYSTKYLSCICKMYEGRSRNSCPHCFLYHCAPDHSYSTVAGGLEVMS